MKKKKKLGKGKGTDECSFGLVNGDFVLRGVAGADSNGLAEGSVGPSRWAHEPLSFFEAFAQLRYLLLPFVVAHLSYAMLCLCVTHFSS